ncbi:hypothetical protein ACFV6F_40415, partial [Kitasatospora phosalacinea]
MLPGWPRGRGPSRTDRAGFPGSYRPPRPPPAAPDGLPRITLIENEYLLAVLRAEERWLRGVIDDLRNGSLT